MYNYGDVLGGYTTTGTDSLESVFGSAFGGALAAFAGIFIVIALIVLAIAIFMIVTFCILFKKCNKPAWAAIIPYYNTWVENEIAGCHWIVFVGSIISSALGLFVKINGIGSFILGLVTLFAGVCVCYNLSKKFGKSTGFCVGLVLLPIVFFPILAFSKNAVYNKDVKVKNCAFFDVNF